MMKATTTKVVIVVPLRAAPLALTLAASSRWPTASSKASIPMGTADDDPKRPHIDHSSAFSGF